MTLVGQDQGGLSPEAPAEKAERGSGQCLPLGSSGRFSEEHTLAGLESSWRVGFPRAPGGGWGGLCLLSPAGMGTLSPCISPAPTPGGCQGSAILSDQWRGAPQRVTGLEPECFPAQTPAGLLGQACRKRKLLPLASGFLQLPGEGGGGPAMTQQPAGIRPWPRGPGPGSLRWGGVGWGRCLHLGRGDWPFRECRPISGKLE